MATIKDLYNILKLYVSNQDMEIINHAYAYASFLHDGQKRNSGEPYITHPINVAYTLAMMRADVDTICAALLHDTLEDTETTKEEIEHYFNSQVALLVDGVTKISRLHFYSKKEQNLANTRKIITSITDDVRIILIKLADRLHNMQTLKYKKKEKQKEIAVETLEIFAPLANYLGAYNIKRELEDLSMSYLLPNDYKKLKEERDNIEKDSLIGIKDMCNNIQELLKKEHIKNNIIYKTKSIYGIYKAVMEGHNLLDIHDLISLKVTVKEIKECYETLGLIHFKYHPLNDKFKDYICNPKTNMYQSLHTTVFTPDDRLIQTQIRTYEMDKVAALGIASHWSSGEKKPYEKMQEDLKTKYQFFNNLVEINSLFKDNEKFINQIKLELFEGLVYAYTPQGDEIELPKGATILDFAFKISDEVGNKAIKAIVNDQFVDLNYVIHNNDIIKVITNDLSIDHKENLEEIVVTAHAKEKLKELNKSLVKNN